MILFLIIFPFRNYTPSKRTAVQALQNIVPGTPLTHIHHQQTHNMQMLSPQNIHPNMIPQPNVPATIQSKFIVWRFCSPGFN